MMLMPLRLETQRTIRPKAKHWPPNDFPVEAIQVDEISAETTPEGVLRCFDNSCSSSCNFLKNSDDVFFALCVVRKSDPTERAASRGQL